MTAKTLLRQTLLALGILFLGYLVLRGSARVGELWQRSDAGLIAAAIALMLLINVVAARLFHQLLGKYGLRAAPAAALRMFLLSQIVKYIPGKVWPSLYQAATVGQIRSGPALLMVNVELAIASSLAVLGVSVACLPSLGGIGLAALALALVANGVWLNSAWTVRLTRRLGFGTAPDPVEVRGVPYVESALFGAGTAALYYLALLLFMKGVLGLPTPEANACVAYLGISWLAGLVVFIVPNGVGVRELVFVALSNLDPRIDPEAAMLLVVAFRLAQVAVDVAGAAAALLIRLPARDAPAARPG